MTHRKLDNDAQVFFYEQEFYCLSNFSSFQVKYAGFYFATAEHLYHWMKFDDTELVMRNAIATARSAHDAYKIANANIDKYRVDWQIIRLNRMRDILRFKFNQHEYIQRKLLETGDRELIEDSWRDDYWGWGENKDGRNMLGKLWMEVREEFVQSRKEKQFTDGGVLDGTDRTTSGAIGQP